MTGMIPELAPLWISLRTSFAATVLALVAGTLAARWMLGVRGKCRAVVDGLFTLPMVLPPTVLGFLLLMFFGRNSPVGQVLLSVGVRVIFSWSATVIAASVVAFPLVYRTVRASFEQIDPSVIHAARTLGLGEVSIFMRVMLPLAWPGVVAGTVLAFARALGEFGATLMIAGNIPGRTQTIPVAIFFAAEGGRMSEAGFWVLVISLISFMVVLVMHVTEGRHR